MGVSDHFICRNVKDFVETFESQHKRTVWQPYLAKYP